VTTSTETTELGDKNHVFGGKTINTSRDMQLQCINKKNVMV